MAADLGVTEWGPAHDSRPFHPKFGHNLSAFATTEYLNHWFHKRETIQVPIAAGADEVMLALAADAYSRTGRGQAYATAHSEAAVETAHGLIVLPERADARAYDRLVTTGPTAKAERSFDRILGDIARLYGQQTAYGVALGFEYPGFHRLRSRPL